METENMKLRKWFSLGMMSLLASGGAFAQGSLQAGAMSMTFAADGTLQALRLHGEDLPLSGSGGFDGTVYLGSEQGEVPEVLYRNAFGADDPPWQPAAYAKHDEGIGAQRLEEEGRPFVRVGGAERFGHGLEIAEPLRVAPGSNCVISWRGRVPDGASSYIVYLRIFDANGEDITKKVSASRGWTYSPFSFTHYKNLIVPGGIGDWRDLSATYQMPTGAHALTVAICLWRGTHADVGEFSITQNGRVVTEPLRFDQRQCRQVADAVQLDWFSSEHQLALQARFSTTADDCVRVQAELSDRATPPRPRAILLRYALPVALTDWTWHRDWRQDEVVVPDKIYANIDSMSGHSVSLYPFSALSKNGRGLVMGTAFTDAVLECRRMSSDGIATEWPIGILPMDGRNASAQLSFLVFPFEGRWGFRSAARRYYAMFAEAFRSRTKPEREGLWLWPVAPSQLPDRPEDFGLAFWEAPVGLAAKESEVRRARELGLYILPYTEAWGMRQAFPAAKSPAELPPVAERLKQLEEWAADTESKATWFHAPRHIAARAALNSLPLTPEGEHPFSVDKYGTWSHWWRTNSDPALPLPNRASICWEYELAPAMPSADGVYLDSLSYGFAVDFLNVRPEHLAVYRGNLCFDALRARPGIDGMQHQLAFVRWLAERLHAEGKILHGNTFGVSHRFHAPLIDVFGCEVGSFGSKRKMENIDSDSVSGLKRFYAYRRPVSNLLQEGNYNTPVPALTQQEITWYIDHQLFYGFFPGVCTIGGEETPGYANWRRYFRGNSQCDRDRELFKEAVPLIRRLNAAGWQPETGMRSDNPALLIERYGEFAEGEGTSAGELFFTLRNPGSEPLRAMLWLEACPGVPAFPPGTTPRLESLRQGQGGVLVGAAGTEPGKIAVELAPLQTAVLKMARP
jgi:hypothetical protein